MCASLKMQWSAVSCCRPRGRSPRNCCRRSLTGKHVLRELCSTTQPNASLFDLMEEIERRIISDRLERCHWNQTEAAEYFQIPLSTLNQKIKRLNVEVKKRARD